jgi:hypothetical protein
MTTFSDFGRYGTRIQTYKSFTLEPVSNSPKNERVDFYLEYFKNLSPEGFELSSNGDSITIKVPPKTT